MNPEMIDALAGYAVVVGGGLAMLAMVGAVVYLLVKIKVLE